MAIITRKVEQGGFLTTRVWGIRVLRRRIGELSGEEKYLRNEFLCTQDVKKLPQACGFARDVQLVSLEFLRQVMHVSDAEGFQPWVISGALLGLVRQQGRFIPWDDDVDLAMIREEWDRFVDVFNAKAEPGFTARYRYDSRGTKIKIEHKCLGKTFAMTIWPVDRFTRPLPTLEDKRKFHHRLIKAIKELEKSLPRKASGEVRKAALADFSQRVLREGLPAAPASAKPALYRGMECPFPEFRLRLVTDYDEVFPLKRSTFEGVEVNIPNDPESILTYEYGNWGGWPGTFAVHHLAGQFSTEKALLLHRFLHKRGRGSSWETH